MLQNKFPLLSEYKSILLSIVSARLQRAEQLLTTSTNVGHAANERLPLPSQHQNHEQSFL